VIDRFLELLCYKVYVPDFECFFRNDEDYVECREKGFEVLDRVYESLEKALASLVDLTKKAYGVEVDYILAYDDDVIFLEILFKFKKNIARISYEIRLIDADDVVAVDVVYRNAIMYIEKDIPLEKLTPQLFTLPIPYSPDKEIVETIYV